MCSAVTPNAFSIMSVACDFYLLYFYLLLLMLRFYLNSAASMKEHFELIRQLHFFLILLQILGDQDLGN